MRTSEPLSRSLRDRYVADGYVLGPRVLSDDEADSLAALLRECVQNPTHPRYGEVGRGDGEPFEFLGDLRLHFAELDSLTRNKDIVAVAEEVLDRAGLQVFEDRLFRKPPHHPTSRAWHRDSTYLPLQMPYQGIGVWVALNDADADNGGMWMLPGSHHETHLPDEFGTEVTIDAVRAQGYSGTPDPIVVPKGHIHLHNPAVLHASGANLTHRDRIAVAIFYVDPSVRFDANHRFARFFSGTDNERLDPGRYAHVSAAAG